MTGALLALLFSALGLCCLLLTLVGLPGTWLLLALAVGTQWLTGALGDITDPSTTWWTIAVCAVLAVLGEVVETAAGAAGNRAAGGTTRGMAGAIVGGIVGGLVFTPLLPIPLVGTLVGAIVGTFAGALAGEWTGGDGPAGAQSVRAAAGATIGRLLGSMGKMLLAAVMWVVLTLRFLTA